MITSPTSFEAFLNNNLNPEQKLGVITKDGPLLVIAGAGSGKTRVITARIANLILNEGVGSQEIIALTFTNKAAKEMQERIYQFLPKGMDLPFIGTFHSYCVRQLKTNAHFLESPFFTIMDEDDQQKLLTTIIQKHALDKKTTVKQLSYAISSIKNRIVEPHNPQIHQLAQDPMLQEVYHAYEGEKKASRCLDFDDLMLEVLKLFSTNTVYKLQHRNRVRHILVDEYQDTNLVQHALLKHMAQEDKNSFAIDSLCVVGDEDQSIYSWRGATVTNILNFTKDFPGAKTIKIEQNYRSVQPILDIANHVIQHNTNRNPKVLWSDRQGENRVRLLTCQSDLQEGDVLAHFLKLSRKKDETNAILYRAHYQSRSIEEALLRNSMPYKIIGGIQFYERKEIKDLLAYLKLIVNPFDRPSFLRVINCPARGLGQKFEELFYETWASELFMNFKEIAQKIVKERLVTGLKKTSLEGFIAIFEGLQPYDKPSKALERIVVASGYIAHLKNSLEPQEADARIENIKELMRAITFLESQGTTTIGSFLDDVALMQEKLQQNENSEENPIYLMTLHAAKGLEFDTVALCGLEEGLLPGSRALLNPEDLEEERRLFYVGITRARERLVLSYAKSRYTYGRINDQRPSRFIKEIPQESIPVIDCAYLSNYQLNALFDEWLSNKKVPQENREVLTFGAASRTLFSKATPSNIAKAATHQAGTHKNATSHTAKTQDVGVCWKKNQPVNHTKFGIGIIQEVEVKNNDHIYITAKFKDGTKKIDAKFLSKV